MCTGSNIQNITTVPGEINFKCDCIECFSLFGIIKKVNIIDWIEFTEMKFPLTSAFLERSKNWINLHVIIRFNIQIKITYNEINESKLNLPCIKLFANIFRVKYENRPKNPENRPKPYR